MTSSVVLHRADLVDYQHALQWQRDTADAVRDDRAQEAIVLLQHPPVFTLGVRGTQQHLRHAAAWYARAGAPVLRVDRGGDVTFHGPGQLVVYPILNVRRRALAAGDYVRALEQTVIETLAVFGLTGQLVAGRPGIWLDGAKVAALGVRIQAGVTRHGLALNVSPDLRWFDAIVPCGIADAEVTSMARALGAPPQFAAVADAFCVAFRRVFSVKLLPIVGPPLQLPSESSSGSPVDVRSETTVVRAG